MDLVSRGILISLPAYGVTAVPQKFETWHNYYSTPEGPRERAPL